MNNNLTNTLKIFIGWDSREDIAYQVARQSIIEHASIPVEIIPIKVQNLKDQGIYYREIDPLAATEFTYSRFLTPHLMNFEGWALFIDCDFLFFGDVAELLPFRDTQIAVHCVHHDYTPKDTMKMDGKNQTNYPRKNWSSMMLLNCSHPACKKLTVADINAKSGAYLHQMKWAKDCEIGSLPSEWNWLEGWDEKPRNSLPKAVHYTRGGPWFENCKNVDYADEWQNAALQYESSINS